MAVSSATNNDPETLLSFAGTPLEQCDFYRTDVLCGYCSHFKLLVLLEPWRHCDVASTVKAGSLVEACKRCTDLARKTALAALGSHTDILLQAFSGACPGSFGSQHRVSSGRR